MEDSKEIVALSICALSLNQSRLRLLQGNVSVSCESHLELL